MSDRHEEARKLQDKLRITTPKAKPVYGYKVSGGGDKKEFFEVFQTRAYTRPKEDKR